MGDYYDKEGHPLELMEWAALLERRDPDYKRIDLTILTDGAEISTVWLGLNHRFSEGPPLIFETMVFSQGKDNDGDTDRYSTLAEAQAGHLAMVAKYQLALSRAERSRHDTKDEGP